MAETIYSIPIKEAFAKDGCPFCALRADAEKKALEYILGGAHMEPAVRAETNRLGFCRAHMEEMLGMKNRLALALLLESRMSEMLEGRVPLDHGCFVCAHADAFESACLGNAVYLWETDAQFAAALRGRADLCPQHAGDILAAGARLRGTKRRALTEDIRAAAGPELTGALLNLRGFIRSFDHKNGGSPPTDAERAALERAIELLT